MVGKICETDRF